MGYSYSHYVAYGVPVVPEGEFYRMYELAEELATAPVTVMTAGDHDRDMPFLVIRETWKSLELGGFHTVDPYQATDGEYPKWDWMITEAAEKHRMEILAQPAWIFVPDYG